MWLSLSQSHTPPGVFRGGAQAPIPNSGLFFENRQEDVVEADFSNLLAVVKLGQVESASSTSVLAQPTGTCLEQSGRKARKKSFEAVARMNRRKRQSAK